MIGSIIRAFDANLKISKNYAIASNIAVGLNKLNTKMWLVVCRHKVTGFYGILHSYNGIDWFVDTKKNEVFKSYTFGQPIFLIHNPNTNDFKLFNMYSI